jgi:hypothetical protein
MNPPALPARERPNVLLLPLPIDGWIAMVEIVRELAALEGERCGFCAQPRAGCSHDGRCIVARAALLKRACDGDEAAIRRFVACRKPCLPNTGPACTACFERLSHERAIVGPPALVAGAVVITHASLLFSTGVPAPKNLIANRRASCEGLVLERVRDCDAWLVQHDHGTAVYLPGEFTRRLEGAP